MLATISAPSAVQVAHARPSPTSPSRSHGAPATDPSSSTATPAATSSAAAIALLHGRRRRAAQPGERLQVAHGPSGARPVSRDWHQPIILAALLLRQCSLGQEVDDVALVAGLDRAARARVGAGAADDRALARARIVEPDGSR